MGAGPIAFCTKHVSRVAQGALESYGYPAAVRSKEGGHLGRCLSCLSGSARGRPRVEVPSLSSSEERGQGASVIQRERLRDRGATEPEAVELQRVERPWRACTAKRRPRSEERRVGKE